MGPASWRARAGFNLTGTFTVCGLCELSLQISLVSRRELTCTCNFCRLWRRPALSQQVLRVRVTRTEVSENPVPKPFVLVNLLFDTPIMQREATTSGDNTPSDENNELRKRKIDRACDFCRKRKCKSLRYLMFSAYSPSFLPARC